MNALSGYEIQTHFEPLSGQSSRGKPVTNITDKFTFDTDNIVAMNKADTKG